MSRLFASFQELFQKDVIESPLPVVVDFYSQACYPCRVLARQLDRLAEEFAGRVKFVKLDIDEEQELAREYEVAAVPMLFFFQQGQVVQILSASLCQSQLRTSIEDLLQECES